MVTGEGTAFCSGGNTGWIASEPDAAVDHLRTRMMAFYRAWLSIRPLEVPTIAAVNGPAIGAGPVPRAGLRHPVRRGGRQARRAVREARACTPGMAATYLLPDVVGEAHARELLLTGRIVDAEEALRLGLVSRVFAADDVRATTCSEIAAGHRGHGADREPLHQARAARRRPPRPRVRVQWEALAQPITLATADLQEGIRAAREKRPPQFRGA